MFTTDPYVIANGCLLYKFDLHLKMLSQIKFLQEIEGVDKVVFITVILRATLFQTSIQVESEDLCVNMNISEYETLNA